MTTDPSVLLLAEAERRLIRESIPRIRKCLSQLSEKDIWYRPNANSNSVGNLILHLCGNVRQWLVAGLGKGEDRRQRDREFSEKGPIPTSDLLKELEKLEKQILRTLSGIQTDELAKDYIVQGFEETGVSILVHVVEHFSYHVGQITYITKARLDIDTGYYAGLELG